MVIRLVDSVAKDINMFSHDVAHFKSAVLTDFIHTVTLLKPCENVGLAMT